MRAAIFFGSLGLGAILIAGAGFAQEPGLPDGPGKEKLMTACTACHAITEVTNQRREKTAWADTVDQMIARGAQVSDEDYPVIVEYLGAHFAPAGTGAPATAKP